MPDAIANPSNDGVIATILLGQLERRCRSAIVAPATWQATNYQLSASEQMRRAPLMPSERRHGAVPQSTWPRVPNPSPKQLGRTVLLSGAFANFVKSDFDLERVGEYPVRGFNDPIELFAYHG